MPKHFQTRQEMTDHIIRNPLAYKICEGCGSILIDATRMCPNCHAYRFDSGPDHVISCAKKLRDSEQTTVTPEDMDQ